MEDSENRTLIAAETLLAFVDANNAVWTGDTSYQGSRDDLHDEVDIVKALGIIQKNDNKGLAVNKDLLRLDAARKATLVGRLMSVWARKTGNTVLLGEVGFTFSELYYGGEELLVGRWKVIFDRATTNLTAMITFGVRITAPVVTAIDTARTVFITSETTPAVAKVGVKTASGNIKTAMKDLDNIAEDLIDGALGYEGTAPDFVTGVGFSYRKGAVGKQYISLLLHFVDDVTGVELRGVKTTVTDGIKIHLGKSSKKGNEREKDLENGNYSVTAEKATYIPYTQTGIGIASGKMVKITIRLKKS